MQIEVRRADVAPGEAWAETADRVASGVDGRPPGPVLAVDLSGDPLRFVVDPEHRLALRPMTEGDLGDVTRWVNTPHVVKWWDENRSPTQVREYYGPALRGADPTRLWIWEVNGRSVGFCQDYRIADHADYSLLSGRPDAVGYDYVIGEAAYVDRGLGTRLLWVFLRDIVVPAYDGVRELFAAPDHRNARSLRVLDKLGATRGLWFDEPQSDGRVDTVVGCSIDVRRVLRECMTVRVGISGWRYPPWRGDFYPGDLPQRRELEYAASQLTSIEINGSFYSLQRPSSWEKWRREVPEDFVFAVKGGRFISHMKRLRDAEVPLANFFAQGVLALGPKLGPILWQLPATFAWDAGVVRDFCALLPRTTTQAAELAAKHDDKIAGDKLWTGTVEDRPLRYALEPRHRSFEADEALAVLSECDIALVVADSAGKWPRFEQAIGPLVYARLHGDTELYASGYTDEALDAWAEKLRGWTADGRDGFVFFDNDMKGYAPHDAKALIARLE